MYAVTGITGKVGSSVARALLKARLPVRAVVRDEAKGRPWAERGCDVAVAALDDPAALANAFSGVEGVFAMMPPIFDPTPAFPEAKALIATLHEAVSKAAPERVVALSSIGADADRPNLLNQLGLLERSLSELPMPIAFLRPAWFMENAAADIQSARSGGVIRSYLQPLDHPIPMIAAEDVGCTAAALLQEIWKGTRVVELEAAARVTPITIAAAFAKALGRPVRAEAIPRTRWEEIFRGAGMNNPLPRIQMIDGFNEGWIDFPEHGASARKGEISLEQAIAALIETVGETAQ